MTNSTNQIRSQVESIPERLLELKGDRSTAAFARFLRVGVSTLHNYENGRTPPIEFLLNVAAQTGVSVEWLLTGKGEKHGTDSSGEGSSKTRRILVVDDKEYQRDSICNVLEAEGYEVGRAANVNQSIEKLELSSYDIVVTDLRMPEENDGLVLLRHIR
ncbi:MAG: response regulator, partial [bacterium]